MKNENQSKHFNSVSKRPFINASVLQIKVKKANVECL